LTEAKRRIHCVVLYVILSIGCIDGGNSEQPDGGPQTRKDRSEGSSEVCEPSCEEVYALEFDFENECVLSNSAETYIECVPMDKCNAMTTGDRFCLVSPGKDLLVVFPEQISTYEESDYMKSELGWKDCRDLFEYYPVSYVSMFPVCGPDECGGCAPDESCVQGSCVGPGCPDGADTCDGE